MRPAIFLMGPTASGKTAAAVELVQHLPLEIISVDSALVFRDMDIGTAKPDASILAKAPHHLLDLIDPTQSYSAAQFRHDALQCMQEITARGRVPLLVGGTMLYFNALQYGMHDLPQADPVLRAQLEEEASRYGWPVMHARLALLDPVSAARLEPTDAQRIGRALEICLLTGQPMSVLLQTERMGVLPYRLLKMALIPSDRSVLHARIEARFDAMLAAGFLEEVRALQTRYPGLNACLPSMRCVGYRQAWQYLAGEYDMVTLRAKACAATRQLAKRQLTWLRSMRDAEVFDMLEPALIEKIRQRVTAFLAATTIR